MLLRQKPYIFQIKEKFLSRGFKGKITGKILIHVGVLRLKPMSIKNRHNITL